MNKRIAFIGMMLFVAITSRADEGMWVLTMLDKLNIATMQQKGCRLSAEDIYSVNNSSIKDAVVIFGGGCTGEIVSENGLVFTNHHCGYSSIQQLSSVEHNYLKDGFWSRSFEEDLPVDGLSVRFVVRFEECTDKILEGISDDTPIAQRDSLLDKNTDKVLETVESLPFHKAMVESFFGGNQFFLIEYAVYNDVRLVGTPPESIGKFGHDTDNWMWPRHTGDFSIFRVYADENGQPAEYSASNKPLKPKHYLPISLKGTELGDFAMTVGFPGSTDRYQTSFGIDARMNIENQAMIGPRTVKQEIWLESMQKSEKVNIQYASKYASSTNYWKNSIGMNRGLTRLNIIEKKQQLEAEFQKWADATPERKAKYGNVLSRLEKSYKDFRPYSYALEYLYECQIGGPEVFRFAYNARDIEKALNHSNPELRSMVIDAIRTAAQKFFKNYDAQTDKDVIAALGSYYFNLPTEFVPDYMTKIVGKKYKGNFEKFAADLIAKSMFVDETRLAKFLEKPSAKVLAKDPAYQAAVSIFSKYYEIYYGGVDYMSRISEDNRLFIKGLMEMQSDKAFYSDANFTMRLSYGSVGDYDPSDAVHYKHFTTLKGVMEKEDPTNWEFVVDPKLKSLYENKDFGRYADKDGTMHVCFTTNNDITGGNSGSPVINGDGELIGLAFDGNWEAMSGDIAFENELQKCINVDIRYVLFVIDKIGNAKNIIDELKIVE